MQKQWAIVALWTLARVVIAAPEYVPIQERAQGHSLIGAVQFNDSLYSNPAASGFTQIYSVEGSMMQGALAASVVDTKTSYIGGSLGYIRKEATTTTEELQALRLGFCRKISEMISVGVMGKSLWNSSGRMNDGDAGILMRVLPFEFGMVSRNILGGSTFLENQRREIGIGIRLNLKDALYFSASSLAVATQPASPYEYGFGAEFVSPYFFSVKGGYRIERETGETHWSAGASLLSPRISAHYAVEFANAPNTNSAHQVAVSLLF